MAWRARFPAVGLATNILPEGLPVFRVHQPFSFFALPLCVILDRIGLSASRPVYPRSRSLERTFRFGSFVPTTDFNLWPPRNQHWRQLEHPPPPRSFRKLAVRFCKFHGFDLKAFY
jgi:hypothetical protein